MVATHKDEVKYVTGATVTSIKRTPTVEVKYTHEGVEKQLEADVFISAIDLYRFRHLTDLDPEEAVFSKLTESVLTTTSHVVQGEDHRP